MTETQVMELPDGRDLAWLERGDPTGPVVFVFHGTPGSRRQVSFDDQPIAAAGVRFVAPDRPGYGHSGFQRGRHLCDWATDVARLADRLQIDTFSVVGYSGGGPHALVCARFLGERVVGAGVVSGIGPLDGSGSEKDMMGSNRVLAQLARVSPYLLYPPFALFQQVFRRWPDRALELGARQLPPSDIEVMSRPEVKAAFVDDYRRAPATSPMAAAQDFYLFAHDWGFRLEDINVPVHVWHGSDDRNVPISHGRFQAEQIPRAKFHELSGEGHMLFVDHLEEVLQTVCTVSM